MKITTILPVSRIQYLDRVIESLLNQTYKPNNLIVIFDGPDSQFLEVRNKIVELKFDAVLCVPSENFGVAHAIPERRRHISNIHNQFKTLIENADWIFSIEDDGILPLDALEKLVNASKKLDNIGMITGVELGRWGVPYVGAWIVDDVSNPQKITSIDNKSGQNLIEEIDACGLYCALIRTDLYKQHTFFYNNGLGPDINLGIFIRQHGYNNYIDWSICIDHLTIDGGEEIIVSPHKQSRTVTMRLLYGETWQIGH